MNSYNTEDLSRIEPDYLDAFGLREAPFSPRHEDRFLYVDAERAQNLNLLQHLTHYSNLLLIVQGEAGVGKTALLERFMRHTEPDWQICRITANTMMDAEQLLFEAAQGFGMQQLPEDSTELEEMLYARVATLHHNEQTPILVIDDAHQLPKDALLAIFNLADAYVNNVNLLRVILFSDPVIERIIETKEIKPLRERVTHTMELLPFDEAATAEYLKHRLAVAGFLGGSPFTPKMVKKIYRASQGIPEKINELAHQTLQSGDFATIETEPEEQRLLLDSGKRSNNRPMIFASLAVFLVALALVFQDQINALFEENQDQEQTEVDVVQSDTMQQKIIPLNDTGNAQLTDANKQVPDDIPEQVPEQETAKVTSPKQNESVAPVTAELPEPASEVAETDVSPDSQAEPEKQITAAPLLHSVQPNPVPGSRKPQTLTLTGEGFTPDTNVVVSWPGNNKTLSGQQVTVKNDKEIEISITVGTNADDWQVRVQDPQGGQSEPVGFIVQAAVDKGDQQARWILAQDPQSFTLQLFATNNRQSAESFIRQHKLQGNVGYFESLRDGKPWYSVVYGAYPDQTTAKSNVKSLPASLQKVKPWIRRFDDIHASINTRRKQIVASRPRPATPETTVVPISVDNLDPDKNASWLWSQDPSNYTLQLLGARQSDSVKKFLRKYTNLNGRAVYFHTRHDARDWYTVVYGVYPTRESAKQAIARLPAELQSASPWIRSFSSIHAELDQAERN